LDIITLLTYLSGITFIGIYFSRKNVSTEQYFVGGRAFSGWVIGISMIGTSISSVTFIAYPGDAFKTAWLRFLPNLTLPVCIIIAAYIFLPFFRRGKITSAYEYLEYRFGPSIRTYGSIAFIITQLVRVSMILYLISLVIYEITGLSPVMSIVTSGIIVAIYTIMGGINAVIWTDATQTIIFVIGGLLCLFVVVNKLPGGLGQIFSVAIADHKFAFAEWANGNVEPVSWAFSLKDKTAGMMLIIGLTIWLNEYSTNQNVIQRYCASKSTKEARKAMYVCAFTSIPIWAFFMFLGTSLYVFFKVYPTVEATEMLTGVRKADQILPFFIINYMPPGITGIVIAAILAAGMSSLDSSINAISTVTVVDIYRRHLVKNKSDKHYLKVAWIAAAAASVIMIIGAILLVESGSNTFQDTAVILGALFSGGLLGLYMLGFFTKKGDARSVGFGIIFTLAFTTWTILSDKQILPEAFCFPFNLYYIGIGGNFMMFVVGYIVGTILPAKKRDLKNLNVWEQTKMPLE